MRVKERGAADRKSAREREIPPHRLPPFGEKERERERDRQKVIDDAVFSSDTQRSPPQINTDF